MLHDAIPERDRSEARRRAILDVAETLFLDRGYAATSMSEIAARLGGSKGTLYNYFRSKEELFAALMTETCRGRAAEVFDHLPPIGEDFRESLIKFGSNFLDFLLRAEVMAVHRLVVAESDRFPELGRIFYEYGPKRSERLLTDYFQRAMELGKIRPGDARKVGQRLKDLIMSDVYSRRLWGVIETPTPAQIREHVADAVDVFLRAFGP